jgi:hypothetical protein
MKGVGSAQQNERPGDQDKELVLDFENCVAAAIGAALTGSPATRLDIIAVLAGGLANAIAYLPPNEAARTDTIATLIRELPGMVERVRADGAKMRGTLQ